MAKIIVPVSTLIVTLGFGGVFGYYAKKASYIFSAVRR